MISKVIQERLEKEPENVFTQIEQMREGILTTYEVIDNVYADVCRRQTRAQALSDLSNLLANEARGVKASIASIMIKLSDARKFLDLPALKGDTTTFTDDGLFNSCVSAPEFPHDGTVDDVCKELTLRKSQAQGLREHIKELTDQYRQMLDDIDAGKARLLSEMQENGEKVRKGKVFSARVSNTKACVITDEDAIPARFMQTTTAPNITEIKQALLNGEDVDGAKIENRTHLTITK